MRIAGIRWEYEPRRTLVQGRFVEELNEGLG